MSLWSALIAALFVVATGAEDQASCTDPSWNWSFNSRNQDPCHVSFSLGYQCYPAGEPVSFPPLPSDQYYSGTGDPTPCVCNTVYYSLLSACGECQGGYAAPWPDWSKNCTSTTQNYPKPIPDDFPVPDWAFMPLLSNGTVNFTAAQLDDNSDVGQAKCTDPGWAWSFNSQNQDPCHVLAGLGTQCSPDGTVPILRSDSKYSGPTHSNECSCNTVSYSLLSLCAACQDGSIVTWPIFSENCTNPSVDYPMELSQDFPVPDWALLPLLNNGTVNFTAARLDTKPDLTENPSLHHHTVNVGAIAGGVVGVLGLLAVGTLIWFCCRRRKRKHNDTPAPVLDLTASYPPSPVSSKAYDPSDPSTYPHSLSSWPQGNISHSPEHSQQLSVPVTHTSTLPSISSVSSPAPASPTSTYPQGFSQYMLSGTQEDQRNRIQQAWQHSLYHPSIAQMYN